MIKLGGGWDEALEELFQDENYAKIHEFLKQEYSHHVVYPDMYDIYNCFKLTPFERVKVVLLGQDPYHNVNQAHGLCFSVKEGVQPAPVAREYFSGTQRRRRMRDPFLGRSDELGERGRFALEHRAHGARASSQFAQKLRLDVVYRQRDPHFKRKSRPSRIHSLGRQRAF